MTGVRQPISTPNAANPAPNLPSPPMGPATTTNQMPLPANQAGQTQMPIVNSPSPTNPVNTNGLTTQTR
jgi:hypothetical protein